MQSKTAPNWSKEEVEYLYEIANTDAFYALVKKFQKQATEKGWYQRQNEAIKTKMKRLKISIKPLDGGWNCGGLAQILEVDRDRVHDWVDRGLLKSSRKAGTKHHRIIRSNLIAFATDYPDWITGINEDNLRNLLPNPVVDKIIAQPIRTRGMKMPVQTNTGARYSSMRAAARGEHYSKRYINQIAKTGASTRDGLRVQLIQN